MVMESDKQTQEKVGKLQDVAKPIIKSELNQLFNWTH